MLCAESSVKENLRADDTRVAGGAGYRREMTRRPETYGDGRGELVLVLDCSDLDTSALFWTAALGYVDAGGGETYRTLLPSDGSGLELLLQRVTEHKETKNRVHLDLRTRDLDTELGRIRDLGARQVTTEPIVEHGWTWHVMTDPDGNELCVLQPPDDYWVGK